MVPIKPPSTSSLASAVFPHPVGGPEIDGELVNVSVSHKGSLQAIMDVMKFYGFDPVLFTNKGPLQKIRKQQDEYETTKFAEGHDIFQKERVVYIYCKRCFNNVPDRDTFSCTVIATVQYDNKESKEKNRAMCSVLAIYPHSCQCTTNYTQRSNYKMDLENGGCGYGKYEFPHEEICRDVFDVFVDKFSSIGEEGEHGGIKISNVTNEHEDYELDQRWFMHLQKDENISDDQWGIQTTLYKDFGTDAYDEKVKAFLHRLTLWLANHLNDPDGFCTSEDEDQCSRKKRNVQLHIGPPSSDTPSGVRHLQLEKAAIISGGHKGNNTEHATDQMPHFDQSSIIVDELEYEVSTNPMLKGCTKPFSVIIPLLDYRRIFTLMGRIKTYHNISLGELFLFAGDVSHGGTTTNKFDGYHPCIHINITSTYHSVDLTYFDVDIDGIAIHDPMFLGRLDKAPVTEALSKISNVEYAAFTHAMKNPQAKDTVKALIGEQISRLQALCIASDDNEEMSSTPPSPVTKKPKLPPTPTKSARSNDQLSCYVETPNGSILQHFPDGGLLPIPLRKLETLHQTISDAEEMIEHTVGPRLPCKADGSCGYHGAIMTLSTMKLGGSITVTSSTTIQDFRRSIDLYARENIDAFCGRQDDGNDSIFLTNKGKPGYPTQRNQRKPVDIRKQNFKNTIIQGIYSKRKNYNNYVTSGLWMNAMYVLPIIVHLYKPKEKFVLYTSQMKDEKDSTKGMLFCTDVFQYNTTTEKVYRTHYFDEIKIVHGPKRCMVLFTCINHFEAVTINGSESYKSEE